MTEQLNQVLIFFESYGLWIAAGSVIALVTGLAAIPYIVAAIPVDYFHYRRRHGLGGPASHPLIRVLVVSVKNLLGGILVVAGIIMLFTPGQGLLSILIGLMIMNYPGKYRLECWIINRPLILKTVNRLRDRRGQPPLLPPI
jgi:hypothetical protein